ncbi:MAG TPA: hypothetical protein VGI63_04920 [Verrucomicrobiae bacterium]|jgi:hypothetical protein
MQTSKFPLWICALALGGALALHAQDTPAQIAARAAVQQKMAELDANPTATAPAPATPATEVPATPATQPATETPASTAPAAPEAATPATTMPADAAPAPTMATSNTPSEMEAQKAADAQAKIEAQKQAEAKKAAMAQAAALKAGKSPAMQPITAPPLPFSAAKQEKLQLLLGLYKSDKITASEYQDRRAKIIAGP